MTSYKIATHYRNCSTKKRCSSVNRLGSPLPPLKLGYPTDGGHGINGASEMRSERSNSEIDAAISRLAPWQVPKQLPIIRAVPTSR